ncbi:MAG: hypothetical protein EOO20_03815 [Chryseobacterium sp.]|nr:MAG: hypothetical protein EOO20_03815 [Chryseobacterium sp.]
MNNFQFRFWDKNLKKMCFRKPSHNDFTNPKIVPMMFIGAIGANSVEVWQDDVCEVQMHHQGKPIGDLFKAGIKYNEHIGAFQIKYKCMGGGFATDNIGFKYFLKVIGNVYEHPELLN